MARRAKSTVRSDSAKAVAAAGTRERGGPSGSAGHWTARKGKSEGPWRPGKTEAKSKGRRS